MRIIGIQNFKMMIVSEHDLPDDIYSDCKLDTFELYEIRSIEVNRLLNTNNKQYYPNVLMLINEDEYRVKTQHKMT